MRETITSSLRNNEICIRLRGIFPSLRIPYIRPSSCSDRTRIFGRWMHRIRSFVHMVWLPPERSRNLRQARAHFDGQMGAMYRKGTVLTGAALSTYMSSVQYGYLAGDADVSQQLSHTYGVPLQYPYRPMYFEIRISSEGGWSDLVITCPLPERVAGCVCPERETRRIRLKKKGRHQPISLHQNLELGRQRSEKRVALTCIV